MPLSPAERTTRARIAAHTLHSQISDPAAHTAPARAAFNKRFEDQVDPKRELPEKERARRAESARRAYYLRLSLKGVQARARRAG